MRKFYKNSMLAVATMFCTAGFGQTEIVNDYYSADKGYGVSPNSMISNSSVMVFSGVTDALSRGMLGTTYFWEPFLTDGTADVFKGFNLNPLIDGGLNMGSNPKHFFVFNDEIYFTATDDTDTDGIYKINNETNEVELVTTKWVPANQPQVGLAGFPATEKFYVVGKNPEDETDTNNYLLTWDGTDALPTMKTNQVSMFAGALFSIDGSKNFVSLGGATDAYVFGATNPNEDIGTEVCVYYYNRARGAMATFTDINPGVKVVNDVEYQLDGAPEDFTVIDGVVYFNSAITNKVWKIDLNEGATATLVESINNAINANTTLDIHTVYDGKLVLSGVATTEESATETSPVNLFLYDPVTENVTSVLTTGDGELRDISSVVVLNDILYFGANYRSVPYDYMNNASPLFSYDGTELVNLTPGLTGVRDLHVFNDKIYFAGTDAQGVDNGDGTYSSTYSELFVYSPVENSTTGIGKVAGPAALKIYPNPSSGILNIEGAPVEQGTYSIYDLGGKLMDQGSFDGTKIDYNVSAGTYLLRVVADKETKVTMIVVE